jgi:hypothetical protein
MDWESWRDWLPSRDGGPGQEAGRKGKRKALDSEVEDSEVVGVVRSRPRLDADQPEHKPKPSGGAYTSANTHTLLVLSGWELPPIQNNQVKTDQRNAELTHCWDTDKC